MIFRIFGRLVLAGFVFLVAASAGAQDSEAPLGVHPHGGQTHWYSERCCNLKDCARVKVRIEGDYYVWDSWLFPGEIRTVWIQDPDDIHPSQDTSFHGCEYHLPPERLAEQFTPNPTVDGVYCLYVPPAM